MDTKFVMPSHNSNHSLPVAPNFADQDFTATAPNQIWLTDITYIQTAEEWLYLAAHKDLFNGEIIGYALDKRMTKALVMKSLFRGGSNKEAPACRLAPSLRSWKSVLLQK